MDVLNSLVPPGNIFTATNNTAMFRVTNPADFLCIPLKEERFLRQNCYLFRTNRRVVSCLTTTILLSPHLHIMRLSFLLPYNCKNHTKELSTGLGVFNWWTNREKDNSHTLVIAFVEVSSPASLFVCQINSDTPESVRVLQCPLLYRTEISTINCCFAQLFPSCST